MPLSYDQKYIQKENYEITRKLLVEMVGLCDDILSGTSEREACKSRDFDLEAFRRFVRHPWKGFKVTIKEKDEPERKTYKEKFLYALFDENIPVQADFDECFEYVLKQLDEKSADIMRMRYIRGLTLGDCADRYRLSIARIKQIENKSISILRRYRKVFIDGVDITNMEKRYGEMKTLYMSREKKQQRLEDAMDKLKNNEPVGDDFDEIEYLTSQDVEELPLSVRTMNCLKKVGVKNLYDLSLMTKDDLMSIDAFGKKCLSEITTCLAEKGVSLKEK